MAAPMDEARDPPVAWHREAPATLVLVVLGPVQRSEIQAVCERTRTLLQGDATTDLVCDIAIFERPCAVLLDALARLELVAKRLERSMHLRNASPDMRALLGLTGLAEVLPQSRMTRRARGT